MISFGQFMGTVVIIGLSYSIGWMKGRNRGH